MTLQGSEACWSEGNSAEQPRGSPQLSGTGSGGQRPARSGEPTCWSAPGGLSFRPTTLALSLASSWVTPVPTVTQERQNRRPAPEAVLCLLSTTPYQSLGLRQEAPPGSESGLLHLPLRRCAPVTPMLCYLQTHCGLQGSRRHTCAGGVVGTTHSGTPAWELL